MTAHTVGLLVFLVLIKSFLCRETNLFTIDQTELHKSKKEGSCVEMKCKVTRRVDTDGALWYWIKDAQWSVEKADFIGTVVLSNDASKCSEDFKGRVENVVSSRATWNCGRLRSCEELYSIRICELNKKDTGTYLFRFVRDQVKWATEKNISLTVEDNPCPITFEGPRIAQENQTITLNCSTLTSCTSNLRIDHSKQQPSLQWVPHDYRSSSSKSSIITFKTTWLDDGREFSCETQDNRDEYLIRKVTLTVEYAPRGIEAKARTATVKESDSVTLSCSGSGQPKPDFTWLKGNQKLFSGATWTISSIKETQSGSYTCRAKNKLGERFSTVNITVTYAPHVEVQISQGFDGSVEEVKEGARVTFLCAVKKSSPALVSFTWFKGSTRLTAANWRQNSVVVSAVQPKDSGVYKCRASNSAGTGQSKERRFQVKYKPRITWISPQNLKDNRVKVNDRLPMICKTEAYPRPWYSWYRYRQDDRSKLIPVMSQEENLTLERVQRADEACYICNASNSIGNGDVSEPLCIRVLFRPTSVVLSMEAEVTEGQLVTINCSAESFPPSHFTLTRSSKWLASPSVDKQNSVRHTFTATSTDTGDYACTASNSEGQAQSNRRTLVVKYAPKEVKIEAQHNPVVKENTSFRLDCTARSHPPVTSVTWTKVTFWETETVHRTGPIFFVKSAGPSDSGLYSCEARNEMGTGESQQMEIKVHYGPKHTRIIEGEKHQLPDGTSFVPLSCLAQCYPPVKQYSWYKRAESESGVIKVSDNQNISVSSHEPGEYYCLAENDIGQRPSDSVPLFASRVMKILKFVSVFCLIFIILCIVFFLYRHSRKSIQQRPANTRPCCGFLAQWKASRRRTLMNEAALTGPSRSRDDLLPHQSSPDSTPASNANCVYSTVNLPTGKLAPSAQGSAWQNGAQKEDDSLNYASLHFEKKHRKPKEEVVYAGVTKAKPQTPKEAEDYENATYAGKATHPYDYDTDTSEDEDEDEEEVEVTYSKVTFKPKARQKRKKRDSSTSEDNTQYSELKI